MCVCQGGRQIDLRSGEGVLKVRSEVRRNVFNLQGHVIGKEKTLSKLLTPKHNLLTSECEIHMFGKKVVELFKISSSTLKAIISQTGIRGVG